MKLDNRRQIKTKEVHVPLYLVVLFVVGVPVVSMTLAYLTMYLASKF